MVDYEAPVAAPRLWQFRKTLLSRRVNASTDHCPHPTGTERSRRPARIRTVLRPCSAHARPPRRACADNPCDPQEKRRIPRLPIASRLGRCGFAPSQWLAFRMLATEPPHIGDNPEHGKLKEPFDLLLGFE